MKNTYLPKGIKWATVFLKISSLTFLLFFSFSDIQAQRHSMDVWHEGFAVFVTGDTIKGQIKYDMEKEIVQVQEKKGKLEAYTARKLLIFEIQDDVLNRRRRFITLPYAQYGNFEKLTIFEILIEGKITLLSRERIEIVRRSPALYGNFNPGSDRIVIYESFTLKQGETIQKYDETKNSLFVLVRPHQKRVQDYMKENRLKPKKRVELAQIIAYYNSIK